MAYNRNYNTIKSQAQMTRTLGYPASFGGVDVTSPERAVAENRFTYAMNMWKDYDSESGACIETFPGWRNIFSFGNAVYGMWRYGDYVLVHTGDALKAFRHAQRDGGSSTSVIASGLAQRKSSGFVANGSFWHLDGTKYRKITYSGGSWSSVEVTDWVHYTPYVPTLFASHTILDGHPQYYEQRNMLIDAYKESFVIGEPDITDITATNKIRYQIISEKDKTCRATGGLDITAEIIGGNRTVYIPGHVKIGGIDYTVEEIGEFQSPTNCVELWIGNGVKRIAARAFNTFTQLSILHLPETVELIGSKAFGQSSDTITIYMYSPELDDEASNLNGLPVSKLRVSTDAFNGSVYMPLPKIYTSGKVQQIYAIRDLIDPTQASFDPDFWDITSGYDLPAEPKRKYGISQNSNWAYINFVNLAGTNLGTSTSAATYYGVDSDRRLLYVATDSIDNLIGKTITITGGLNTASINGVTYANCINGCRICAEFDGRIFFGGNPSFPNRIWYTQRDETGVNRPDYVGELNYWLDGAAGDVNVSMLVAADVLCVLQQQANGRGGIWIHQGADTGSDLTPRVYPSNFGSLDSAPFSACCYFRDDAVFLTDHGLDAIAKKTVNLERSIEHRSTNVDNLLLRENLSGAEMLEWNGYLMLLCQSGNVYMADSRQMYRNASSGNAEYEWYLLDEFGMYANMTQKPDSDEMIGGQFYKATKMLSTEGVLYFGTSLGRICVVNTDKRGLSYTWEITPVPPPDDEDDDDEPVTVTEPVEPGRIHRHWYTRCGRRYTSCLTTRYDDCNYPHVTKNTVRKSVDIELRTYHDSRVDISWRTNRENEWKTSDFDGSWNNRFEHYEIDFGNHSFDTAEQKIAVSDEHAKLWVLKQFHLKSTDYQSAWGLYHISYRWQVARRIKN